MAKGDWQLLIPGWNIYYMIRQWWRDKKETEVAEKRHKESLAEHEAIMKRIEALKFERAHHLIMGNKDKADEINRELNDIALKQLNKLLSP